MIKKHEVNVYVPIHKCYDLLRDQGHENGWKVVEADSKNFTMKWQKGGLWWTRLSYIKISLEDLNEFETYVCFTFEDPWNPRPGVDHRDPDFERVIKRFEERVAEFNRQR